jgi:CHAT domain-containing protein
VYDRAWKLFEQGKLPDSQLAAERGYAKFHASNPGWTAKFQLLEAQDMLGQGMYKAVLLAATAFGQDSIDSNARISLLAIEAAALTHQEPLSAAEQKLAEAELLCRGAAYPACGEVLRARGNLALKLDQPLLARQSFLDTVAFAKAHNDLFLETGATVNLGIAEMQVNRYDESLDWSRAALRNARESGAEYIAQIASGNIGWAYLQLGDNERALEQFLDAEKSAARLENPRYELKWITAAGYVYRNTGDLNRATDSYRQAFTFAKQLDSKEDIVNALEDLAQISVDSGKLDEASAYIDKVTPMEEAGGGHLSANVLLTQGMIAAARRQDQQAESLFRKVQSDKQNPTTTRLGAGEQLARLFEAEGNVSAAEQMYKATLKAFDSAQSGLKSEESKLPFVTNAARIYDDYIHLLLQQGRSDEALAVADQSRARTLAQSLGAAGNKSAATSAARSPRQIAQKAGATLLFYWLGQKQSCLWAITPAKIAFFPLPAQADILARVGRYNKAVLDVEDPLETGNEDGQALHRMLVAPASKLIRSDAPVMILADGALSQLNFETLLVAGPSPQPNASPAPSQNLHYWIDDATLVSAPSLAMIDAAKPIPAAPRSLLLLGDPVSPSDDFPSLPLFSFEMKSIQKHFDTHNVAVFASRQATPAAYLSSNPAQYSYIHFVSHAVSSRTAPLDSAIILSATAASPDSFKLYARDIMRRPIDARLVTISACNGSGTRSYAGEGLVGLSWAFLRAGAHSVIGALWEASDYSSPRLMNTLYQGLEDGLPPAAALRKAKLAMLHSNSRFQSPFYWAPFQIYSSR